MLKTNLKGEKRKTYQSLGVKGSVSICDDVINHQDAQYNFITAMLTNAKVF
jgi:hypothetical protein